MKKFKKMLTIFMVGMLVLPFTSLIKVKAEEHKTMNLEETLKDAGIKHDLSNYKETNDQVTIYLFRGKGCGFCEAFLTHIAAIAPEYGKYFKLVSYEVWYDESNWQLMLEVAQYMDKVADGVPFYIIGDKSFVGYSASYDEEILNAIKTEYEKKDKYDALASYKKAKEDGSFVYVAPTPTPTEEQNENNNTSSASCAKKNEFNVWNLVYTIITLGTVVGIGYFYNVSINNKLALIERKIDLLNEKQSMQNKDIDKIDNKDSKKKQKKKD